MSTSVESILDAYLRGAQGGEEPEQMLRAGTVSDHGFPWLAAVVTGRSGWPSDLRLHVNLPAACADTTQPVITPEGLLMCVSGDGVTEALDVDDADWRKHPRIMCRDPAGNLLVGMNANQVLERGVEVAEYAESALDRRDLAGFGWALARLDALELGRSYGRDLDSFNPAVFVDERAASLTGMTLEEWEPYGIAADVRCKVTDLNPGAFATALLRTRAAGLELTPDALVVMASDRWTREHRSIDGWRGAALLSQPRLESAIVTLMDAGLAEFPLSIETALQYRGMEPLRRLVTPLGVRARSLRELAERVATTLDADLVDSIISQLGVDRNTLAIRDDELPEVDEARLGRLVQRVQHRLTTGSIPFTFGTPFIKIAAERSFGFTMELDTVDEDYPENRLAGSGSELDELDLLKSGRDHLAGFEGVAIALQDIDPEQTDELLARALDVVSRLISERLRAD